MPSERDQEQQAPLVYLCQGQVVAQIPQQPAEHQVQVKVLVVFLVTVSTGVFTVLSRTCLATISQFIMMRWPRYFFVQEHVSMSSGVTSRMLLNSSEIQYDVSRAGNFGRRFEQAKSSTCDTVTSWVKV